MKGNRFLEYKPPGFDKERKKMSCNCDCNCKSRQEQEIKESKKDSKGKELESYGTFAKGKKRSKYLPGGYCGELDSYGTFFDKDEPEQEKEENGK